MNMGPEGGKGKDQHGARGRKGGARREGDTRGLESRSG